MASDGTSSRTLSPTGAGSVTYPPTGTTAASSGAPLYPVTHLLHRSHGQTKNTTRIAILVSSLLFGACGGAIGWGITGDYTALISGACVGLGVGLIVLAWNDTNKRISIYALSSLTVLGTILGGIYGGLGWGLLGGMGAGILINSAYSYRFWAPAEQRRKTMNEIRKEQAVPPPPPTPPPPVPPSPSPPPPILPANTSTTATTRTA